MAKLLTKYGWPTRRSQQFKGTADSADVEIDTDVWVFKEYVRHILEDVHPEVKRYTNWNFHVPSKFGPWEKQARKECGSKLPVIFHRGNGSKVWYVAVLLHDGSHYIMEAEQWLRRYKHGRVDPLTGLLK